MKSACAILATLAAPLLCVAAPVPPIQQSELDQLIRNRKLELDYFDSDARQLEHNLSQLGEFHPYRFDPASPLPNAPSGHSAVVADGGMIFDNNDSSLSYIGNVRMNDVHVHMRAAHRFFIRLPQNQEKKQAENKQNAPAAPPQETDTGEELPVVTASGSAEELTAQPKPGPQAKTAKPAAPNTPRKPEAEKKVRPHEQQPPADIITENAAVDLTDSKFLLEGRKAAPSITIDQGENHTILHCRADGAPAKVFGNYQGDILILGSNMVFTWHGNDGEQWKLEAAEGPVYYKASQHCLVVLGVSRLTSSRNTMDAKKALYIVFEQGEEPRRDYSAPFSQFSSMNFKDVSYVDAYGDVFVTTQAEEKREDGAVVGDSLHYDAATGVCLVDGEACTLVYGGNTLHTQGSIELQSNGDAIIRGEAVNGSYLRPDPDSTKGDTIPGKYQAKGPITYDAARNCVILPAGLSARDTRSSFSCTGKAEIYLHAKPTGAAKAPRSGMRMPDLRIAQQDGISRICASGQVRAHNDATATRPMGDLSCDEIEADLITAVTTLKSTSSRQAWARYGEYYINAQAAPNGVATIHLKENGDVQANGANIRTTIPGEKGLSTATCMRFMLLEREKSLLTLGENSRITTPDGILTARAELHAELAPGETAPRPPSKYPHLVYNYSGLRRAFTAAGGTLQTTQISMQCDGPMAMELKPGAQISTANGRDSLRTAMARKNVQLAGKDANGRLMRASGDRLDFDEGSGNFYLRGSTVTLVDEYNTHTASGRGACVTIDPQDNIRVNGERQVTIANQVRKQMDNQKKNKK